MWDESGPPLWIWRGTLLVLAVALAAGVVLAVAIAAGWNNPRPGAQPDWQLSDPLILQVSLPEERKVVLVGKPVESFTLETVATLLDGPDFCGYGLVFRALGPERYQVFAVGADGYLAVLTVEGERERSLLEWQQFPHIQRSQATNRLRVACGDGVCRFWVNDEYVDSLPDRLGSSGDLGFWVRRFGGRQVQVEFAQVAVWQGHW